MVLTQSFILFYMILVLTPFLNFFFSYFRQSYQILFILSLKYTHYIVIKFKLPFLVFGDLYRDHLRTVPSMSDLGLLRQEPVNQYQIVNKSFKVSAPFFS